MIILSNAYGRLLLLSSQLKSTIEELDSLKNRPETTWDTLESMIDASHDDWKKILQAGHLLYHTISYIKQLMARRTPGRSAFKTKTSRCIQISRKSCPVWQIYPLEQEAPRSPPTLLRKIAHRKCRLHQWIRVRVQGNRSMCVVSK